MEKKYDIESCKYQVGDQGPAGGVIVLVMDYQKYGWRYAEAAPKCIAKLNWDDAKRLCCEETHWGFNDWDLPDKDSLVSLLRIRHPGDCVDYYAPGYHWTNERGLALTFWGPTGYWGNTAGHFQECNPASLCAVRPVRKFL